MMNPVDIERRLLERNRAAACFFDKEAPRLARACREMSERFLRGGRLLAFGRGAYATDAQHVSVEFVHPIVVGKRALPALDLSLLFDPWLDALAGPADIAMGFGPPEGDPAVHAALARARSRGAMTFALPGAGDYGVECFSSDPFIHQEMIEVLYHTLWETVHVFFERRELPSEAGAAGFLYPFLGVQCEERADATAEAEASIRMKVADDARLRSEVAAAQSGRIAEAAAAIARRIESGGKLVLFGNGGSATDANDWAIECVAPPRGMRPVPAISLSSEPAVLSALANDLGAEAVFVRQLAAHACPGDVAVAITTSGGSRNIVAGLEEARKRGLLAVALVGYDGGEIAARGLASFAFTVHCDYIPRIQEVQASIYHVLREAIDRA